MSSKVVLCVKLKRNRMEIKTQENQGNSSSSGYSTPSTPILSSRLWSSEPSTPTLSSKSITPPSTPVTEENLVNFVEKINQSPSSNTPSR